MLEVPEPTTGPDQVVIQVHNAGICGTDIHILKSENVIDPPVVMGHEVCGEIVEVGTGVTGFAVGDRVHRQPDRGPAVRDLPLLPRRRAVLLHRTRRAGQRSRRRLRQILRGPAGASSSGYRRAWTPRWPR